MTEKTKPATADTSSTTEKIVESAIALFGKKGIETTSIRDIAELANVNPSLISYHFGGKSGLFLAVMEKLGRDELEVMDRILKKPENSEEFTLRLKMFLDELVDVHFRRPALSVVMSHFFEQSEPESFEIFNNIYMRIYRRMIAFLEEGQDQGFTNPNIVPLHLANILVAGVGEIFRKREFHKSILDTDYSQPEVRQSLVSSIFELCVNGFVKAKTS